MLLGGVPGVIVGSLFLKHLVNSGLQNLLNALLGAILVTTVGWQIMNFLRPKARAKDLRDSSPWLAWLMLPAGAEVGFSSAGAGALDGAALIGLTPLLPAQVVSKDTAYCFIVTLIGSAVHWFSHASDTEFQLQLIIGGIFGAIGGSILSTRVPRRPLRFELLVWLFVLGDQFLFNSYQPWAVPHKEVQDRPTLCS